MADNRDHERPFLVVSSDGGNALPPTGKNLPPLPPIPRKAWFSAIVRAADASPTQIGTALADLRLDHPQETPSGVRTAGDDKLLERI
ncbi:hypothetical protein K9B33_18320 [Sphingobium sp. 3R8]|uniref:hypothetical protein n=1 Tax=Sphingomonadales TaxID=204457 RepID=UPI001CCEBB02|nr:MULTISPECIES: hypothetical protein [Sphingomonadaceae]MBZ9649495.1 hypothetical protein [Sphingobium sp. 3R8]